MSFRRTIFVILSLCVFSPLYGQQAIVPDGRTATQVVTEGNRTDVTTQTIHGRNAYNSFSRFNVPAGNTTNLYVPDAAKNLINMVHAERSQIDGILNSYKDGRIGGNVFFLNPHGILVGAGGVINTGSLTLRTPTQEYMNQLLDQQGRISLEHETRLFEGNIPLNPSGLITVKGKINAVDSIDIRAGGVDVQQGAEIRAGRTVGVAFGSMVNVQGLRSGNELQVAADGEIWIGAAGDVRIAGTVAADGIEGQNAGAAVVYAGQDVTIENGARVSARGSGSNSDGGAVIVRAEQDATLASGAILDASAGTDGDGGLVEFGAGRTTELNGNGLRAEAGDIVIKADKLTWQGSGDDQLSQGGSLSINANEISLTDVVISSRNVAGTQRDDHLNGASIGDSGSISISARTITLTDSKILAHATGTFAPGDIEIQVKDMPGPNDEWVVPREMNASFEMDATSWILGRDITIAASSDNSVNVNTYPQFIPSHLSDFRHEVEMMFDNFCDLVEHPWNHIPVYSDTYRFHHATSSIIIDGRMESSGKIDVESTATNNISVTGFGSSIKGVGIKSVIDSEITLGPDAVLRATDGINIRSNAVGSLNVFSTLQEISAIPADFVFSVGTLSIDNRITVDPGALLKNTGTGNIDILAHTERQTYLGCFGGKVTGESHLGIALSMLWADAFTDVSVDGQLLNSALGGDIIIGAETDVTGNAVFAATVIGGKTYMSPQNDILLGYSLGKLTDFIGKLAGKTFNQSRAEFGLAGSLALIVDSVETNATIGRNAVLRASNGIDISATTKNQVLATATAQLGTYSANGKAQSKSLGGAIALPIVVMENRAETRIDSGATLEAKGGSIEIKAATRIPFNLSHPLYQIATDPQKFLDGEIQVVLNSSLGIDKGFVNTWAQATADTEAAKEGESKGTFGAAGSLSVNKISNTAVAQVCDGVDLQAKKTVKVTADVETDMVNVVGSMRSFLGATPNFLNYEQFIGPQKFVDRTFQSIWGTTGTAAIGGSFCGTFLDQTAIARIDGGTLRAAGVEVLANTKSIDAALVLGGGKADKIGFNGMAGMTQYDSYTLAKIDDSVQVTAKNVSIHAGDFAMRLGLTGEFTVAGTGAFGLSGIVTTMDRQAYALWGNLIDADGRLLTIKGDTHSETIAANTTRSSVSDTIDIGAKLEGLNVVGAVAGSATFGSQSAPSPDDNGVDWEAFQNLFGDNNVGASTSFGLGISGAAAINLLSENVAAGLGGNIDLRAGEIEVAATNAIGDFSIAGAVTAQLKNSSGAGIAGAFGLNILDGATRTFLETVDPSRNPIRVNGRLSLDARKEGVIAAVTAGAAGSSSKGIEIAGSVSHAQIVSRTETILRNANLQAARIDLTAKNVADIVNLGGGLTLGGNLGVGLGVATAYLDLDTLLLLDGATLDVTGDVELATVNESMIVNIAMAGAIAPKGVVLGGALATVVSDEDLAVQIVGSTLDIDGSLDIRTKSSSPSVSSNTKLYRELVQWLQKSEKNDKNPERGETHYLTDRATIDTSRPNEKTSSESSNAKTSDSESVTLGLAARSPRIVGAAIGVEVGGQAAVGANIALNTLTGTNEIRVEDSKLTARTMNLQAIGEGGVIAAGFGLAGATSGVGVSGNVAVNLVGTETQILADRSTFHADQTFTAKAENTGGIINVSLSIAGGSTAGVAAALAYNQVAAATRLDFADTTIDARNVQLTANNHTDIIGVLLSVGGGGSGGVGVSLAINTLGTLADSSTKEDEVEARNTLASQFGNETLWDKIGKSEFETKIVLDDVSLTSGENLSISATQGGKLLSIAVGGGFGGALGAAAAGSYNNIHGSMGVTASDSKIVSRQTIDWSSTDSSEIIAVSVGGSGGETVAVGLGAVVNHFDRDNIVRLTNSSLQSAAWTEIALSQDGKIVGAAGGIAGAGVVGVGAASTTNLIDGRSAVVIEQKSSINSGQDLKVDIVNKNEIIAVAAAGGGGGAFAAAANVAVNRIGTSTEIDLSGAELTALRNLYLQARNDGHILSIAGNLTISGGVGIGGGVSFNDFKDKTSIRIADSRLDAAASGTSSSSSSGKGISVVIWNQNRAETYLVAAGFSPFASVAVESAVNRFGHDASIRIERSDFNRNARTSAGAGQDIWIRIQDTAESSGIVAALAGAVGALAGVSDTHLFDQNSSLTVEDSGFYARRNIRLEIKETSSVESYVSGVAVGAVAVSAALSETIVKGSATLSSSKSTYEAGNDLTFTAGHAFTLDEGIYCVGGGLGVLGFTLGYNSLNHETEILLDSGNRLSAGNNVRIAASNSSSLSGDSYSLTGGMVGVSASLIVSSIDDRVLIDLGDAAIQAGNTIKIDASSDAKISDVQIGAVAFGINAGGGGANLISVNSGAGIIGGGSMTAGREISISAHANRTVSDIDFSAVSGGFIGIGAAVSSISLGGALDMSSSAYKTHFGKTVQQAQKSLDNQITTNHESLSEVAAVRSSNTSLSEMSRFNAETDYSALTNLSSKLDAPSISIESRVDNNVQTIKTMTGTGGVIAIGAAYNIVNVDDYVRANYSGRAGWKTGRSDKFTLKANQESRIDIVTKATAGGLAGHGAANGLIDLDADVVAVVGISDSGTPASIQAETVRIEAKRNVSRTSNRADSTGAGVIGRSGSISKTRFDGVSYVFIENGAQVDGSNITIDAASVYGTGGGGNNRIYGYSKGYAGGLAGNSLIHTDIFYYGLNGIEIKDDVRLGSVGEAVRSGDKIGIRAHTDILSSLADARIESKGGHATSGSSSCTRSNIRSEVRVGPGVLLRSGAISAKADTKIKSLMSHSYSDTRGALVDVTAMTDSKIRAKNYLYLHHAKLESLYGNNDISVGSDMDLRADTTTYTKGIPTHFSRPAYVTLIENDVLDTTGTSFSAKGKTRLSHTWNVHAYGYSGGTKKGDKINERKTSNYVKKKGGSKVNLQFHYSSKIPGAMTWGTDTSLGENVSKPLRDEHLDDFFSSIDEKHRFWWDDGQYLLEPYPWDRWRRWEETDEKIEEEGSDPGKSESLIQYAHEGFINGL